MISKEEGRGMPHAPEDKIKIKKTRKMPRKIVECPECGAPCYMIKWADLSPGFEYIKRKDHD